MGSGALKFALQLDGAFSVNRNFGLGFFGGLTYQSDRPTSTSPKLNENVSFAGIQTPLFASGRLGTVMAIPRIGVARADLNLGESRNSNAVSGFAYGGELAAYFRDAPVGVAVGLLWAPTSAPGDLGRNYNAGGAYFLVSGVIHE